MNIRLAKVEDAEAMHGLHMRAVRETCADFYSDEQVESWLKGRSAKEYREGIEKVEIFVAEEEGEVMGFVHAVSGEIMGLYVDPDFHGSGVGKALLNYGMEIALKSAESVKVDSTLNAENFYSKNAFKKIKKTSVMRGGSEIPCVVMEYKSK